MCRCAFELCFTVIIVTVIHYFIDIRTKKPYFYNIERFMLILFLSILITMVKTTSIASQITSMQSKCLVNQKTKIKRT